MLLVFLAADIARSPHGRRLHYWAKNGLFANPYAAKILLDAGNIPVDRKTKNNEGLYAKTFEVLKLGECVGVFPEGTSLNVPGLLPFKHGISWVRMLVNLRHCTDFCDRLRWIMPSR